MSYFEQQKQIAAENEEFEKRKIEDELEIQNDDAQKALEDQTHSHPENASCHHISNCTVSIEYEQNERVNNFEKKTFFVYFLTFRQIAPIKYDHL